MTAGDRFREWDAAYVLGALSPAERLEFEQHLAECPACTQSVAELAGLPGLLGSIDEQEAFALDSALDPASAGRAPSGTSAARAVESHAAASGHSAPDAPLSVLPTLLSRARRSRRRSRLLTFAVGAGSVAAAAVLAIVVVLAVQPSVSSQDPGAGQSAEVAQVNFVSEVPGPLSATASLQDEPWGTRIEWKCTYDGTDPSGSAWSSPPPTGAPAGSGPTWAGTPSAGGLSYSMVVTDRAGNAVQVATWTSEPGTVATPTATTSIRRSDIASVSILAGATGQVLLTSSL